MAHFTPEALVAPGPVLDPVPVPDHRSLRMCINRILFLTYMQSASLAPQPLAAVVASGLPAPLADVVRVTAMADGGWVQDDEEARLGGGWSWGERERAYGERVCRAAM